MKARRVGLPILVDTLLSQMHSSITMPMRMRKSVVIVYPKQMIPADNHDDKIAASWLRT